MFLEVQCCLDGDPFSRLGHYRPPEAFLHGRLEVCCSPGLPPVVEGVVEDHDVVGHVPLQAIEVGEAPKVAGMATFTMVNSLDTLADTGQAVYPVRGSRNPAAAPGGVV